ncbi:MAG: DUF4234 domain-containing protein [Anaeroplasmataceae bacterium]|nr:DUF4234 domain-containing protein [Anaeroplasmataceae bacterium]
MTKRGIAAVVLLSIFTCGIYLLYWYAVTASDANNEQPENPIQSFIVAWLLGIVTCGIYTLYWEYKLYSKIDSITGKNDAVLHFILSIFLTPIVSIALAQSNINSHVENKGE